MGILVYILDARRKTFGLCHVLEFRVKWYYFNNFNFYLPHLKSKRF